MYISIQLYCVLDEEMADIKDFKLLMTKKSFNIQNDKMFADFVHNVIFKYWTLYVSFFYVNYICNVFLVSDLQLDCHKMYTL